MASKNSCCVWDFTLHIDEDRVDHKVVKDELITHCKAWAFQLERGEITGKVHYQGRVSLKEKSRLPKHLLVGAHWSVTSAENRDNFFYVTKEETRVEGPWTDKDKYIPRQVRDIVLRPWQQAVVDKSKEWDTRSINLIYDTDGNIGKSILCTYMGVHGMGAQLPFVNNYKDLMRMVYSVHASCYLIDMPRAINKDALFQLYGGIETIKSGFAFDDRYEYKYRYFDCPSIWVFTNSLPDPDLMSRDRWNIWSVESGNLIRRKSISELVDAVVTEFD